MTSFVFNMNILQKFETVCTTNIMISNFGCKLLLVLFGWTTAILSPARVGPDFKLASITSSRKFFCSRAIRGHTSNIWSFQQNCQGDVLQQGQLGCKMRVRVTNFTSLVATVDFPLVLISGCVDNYSDQVDSSSEQCWVLLFCGRSKHHWIEDVAPRFEIPKSIFSMCSWWLQIAWHVSPAAVCWTPQTEWCSTSCS